MDHYLDYHVQADEALTRPALISALFTHLHLALVDQQRSDVGVSFPQAGKDLGPVMRVHGTASVLESLSQTPGLRRLRDYHRAAEVAPVPAGHRWCRVARRQPAVSWSKARRMIKRGTLTEEEAEALCQRRGQLSDPYVTIKSQSTGQVFKLFIVQQPVSSPPEQAPSFGRYGLGGTVPWF